MKVKGILTLARSWCHLPAYFFFSKYYCRRIWEKEKN